MKPLRMLGFATLVLCIAFGVANAQTWTPLTNAPPANVGAALLLTDGTVLVHSEQSNSANWYRLTPDINGSYINGTWSQVASMPSGYAPLYFADEVLPDGRVIVEGGEYNNGRGVWTNLGAVFDATVNAPTGQWTSVSPPSGWSNIGDAQSTILSNGQFMLADCCSRQEAIADKPFTPVWTSTGSGKNDENDEEGWSLLPGGNVLTVDAYVGSYGSGTGTNSEIFNPSTGAWTSAGSTIVQLWDSATGCGGSGSASYEVGPQVLMANGTVFATGANSCAAGHTSVYSLTAGTWTPGPDFGCSGCPSGLDVADGPAVLLTTGNVLVMTSPGIFNTPAVFFEWNGSTLTKVPGPTNAGEDSSYYGHLLMLPTGQVLFTDFSNEVELYTPSGSTLSGVAPTALLATATLSRGSTITLFGTRFNGVSQTGAYGDDYQAATNYPIVRFTNKGTGHVFYGRTSGFNTMAVGYPGPTYATLQIPANMETGASTLEVIANGIASPKYPIAIE
jgi:hypothetical protein